MDDTLRNQMIDQLAAYLPVSEEQREDEFTVREYVTRRIAQGDRVGDSTAAKHLRKLCDQGILERRILPGNQVYAYRFTDDDTAAATPRTLGGPGATHP